MKAQDSLINFGEPSGVPAGSLAVFVAWDTGSDLIAYIDTLESGDLPFNVAAGEYKIKWDSRGILRI